MSDTSYKISVMQPYRSGMTMKQKWATDRRIVAEKREATITTQKAAAGVRMMGRNT